VIEESLIFRVNLSPGLDNDNLTGYKTVRHEQMKQESRRRTLEMTHLRIIVALFTTLAFLSLESALEASSSMMVGSSTAMATPAQDKLVYADFETAKDNRPVSSRGGMVQIFGYQESPTNKSRFKGIEGTNAPEAVRISKDDPNRAVTFEYELPAPNQYAGVTLEIQGHQDEGGKLGIDDVSKFKFLSVQIYVTGVTSVTAEFLSRGHGIQIGNGHPRMSFQVKPGFNTYRIPLNSLSQPTWADVKVDPKDVLKKLTSVNLSVACNQCAPIKGTVVVDNLIFQN
jgi:hypothetical protein